MRKRKIRVQADWKRLLPILAVFALMIFLFSKCTGNHENKKKNLGDLENQLGKKSLGVTTAAFSDALADKDNVNIKIVDDGPGVFYAHYYKKEKRIFIYRLFENQKMDQFLYTPEEGYSRENLAKCWTSIDSSEINPVRVIPPVNPASKTKYSNLDGDKITFESTLPGTNDDGFGGIMTFDKNTYLPLSYSAETFLTASEVTATITYNKGPELPIPTPPCDQ